nr:GGDEF domain-containing protein [uncultured Caldimonas sp.]
MDIQTLIIVTLANVFSISLALPAIMGWRVSAGARFAQGAIVTQALGWGSFLLARAIDDRFFSSLWIAWMSMSFVFTWHAMRHWLGPRPGRAAMWVIAALTPVGYWLGFGSYEFRVAWSNFGLAALMVGACVAIAWAAPQASRRWRGLMLASLGALAVVTVWRGVLGGFFPELYPHLRAPHPVNLAAALLQPVVTTLLTVASLVAWREEAEREIQRQAQTDLLTGLLNRRAFSERAEGALAEARRHHDPMVLLIIDLDHFKQINDEGGHAAGDQALQAFATALRSCMRKGELACRYGGEEFCVLLSRAGSEAAAVFDARLRAALRRYNEASDKNPLEFSAGLAVLGDPGFTLDDLLLEADQALYRAKQRGRSRLMHKDRELTPAPAPGSQPLRLITR